MRTPIPGVILCAGKGTRMGQTRVHKVCVPVAGRAAVVRLMDALRTARVEPMVVVVGHSAGDVVQTIGAAHPDVHFVYQRDRLGTGHAARIGIEALCRFGCKGPVLVTMGDKWFEPELIENARQRFERSGADLLAVTTPKRLESTAGRLVHLPGRGIVGIVELRDIQRMRVLGDWLELGKEHEALARAALRRAGLKYIRPVSKLWRALGPLARFSRGGGSVRASELAQAIRETGTRLRVGPAVLGPDQVERLSPTVNESIYIGKINVLQAALHRIGRANAQDEYYLTDVIDLIGGATGKTPMPQGNKTGATPVARVIEYRCRRGDEVLAFNTRAELQRIEEHVREQERQNSRQIVNRQLAGYLRTPEAWLKLLDGAGSRGRRLVERTYGLSAEARPQAAPAARARLPVGRASKARRSAAGALVAERLGALRKVVRLFARMFGLSRRMILVRAPGRVNLMGRHIDHQGGFVHAMALDREVVMAVSPRDDDVIRLVNADPVAFGPRELVIGDWSGPLNQGDWPSFVDGPAVRTHLLSTAGDWSNYVLAAALFQQHRHPDRRIRGMDAAVYGNVPMAAGLSSSSSMVVASMEAIVAVNAIHGSGPDIVSWCGQAEWFVGSRGGSSDHAAIRLGRAGRAARMGFFPFRLSRYVPIPPEAAVLVAYSGQHAVKSAGARDRFNERVACYHLGVMLLQRRHPQLASRLEHVRDLSPSRLGVGPAQIRDMVNDLPERVTRPQIRRELGPAFSDRLERVFSSHCDPGGYTLRDVVAYGVGECERSRLAADYLGRGDLAGFGELMLLSHDGDRLEGALASTGCSAGGQDGSNETPLSRLIGAYACSTAQIDRLVDIARSVPGVYGAQLAGAGLGGCVMILARTAVAPSVKATLAKEYYRPLGMAPAVWQVRSVSGGGLIRP